LHVWARLTASRESRSRTMYSSNSVGRSVIGDILCVFGEIEGEVRVWKRKDADSDIRI